MNQTGERESLNQAEDRKKRVKRLKHIIVLAGVVLLLIPMILCIAMILRLNQMQKQLDGLQEAKEAAVFEESMVYAKESAPEDDSFAEEEAENVFSSQSADAEAKADIEESGRLTAEQELEIANPKKKVYLTFDDGPGKYTAELLDTLKKYEVKATFFVIGKTDDKSKEMYRRIVEEGHTLGMHSYSHQYGKIYQSLEAFDQDFKKISNLLYESTGVRSNYYRFPGGSSNLVSELPMSKFIDYLQQQKVTYYDWNAINGDATGKDLTEAEMVENVMSSVEKNNNSIVLMHDVASKDTTVKSLPTLIEKLKKKGYILLPISEYTNPIQHVTSGQSGQ